MSARQAHLPSGGVLVNVDAVLRGAVAGESGLLVAAFLNDTSGWNASTVVDIKAPGQKVVTLQVRAPILQPTAHPARHVLHVSTGVFTQPEQKAAAHSAPGAPAMVGAGLWRLQPLLDPSRTTVRPGSLLQQSVQARQ